MTRGKEIRRNPATFNPAIFDEDQNRKAPPFCAAEVRRRVFVGGAAARLTGAKNRRYLKRIKTDEDDDCIREKEVGQPSDDDAERRSWISYGGMVDRDRRTFKSLIGSQDETTPCFTCLVRECAFDSYGCL